MSNTFSFKISANGKIFKEQDGQADEEEQQVHGPQEAEVSSNLWSASASISTLLLTFSVNIEILLFSGTVLQKRSKFDSRF